MGERDDTKRRRTIDAAGKRGFLAALRTGAGLEAAAGEAGFTLSGFYGARRRDPAFRVDWEEALELSAARERLRAPPPPPGVAGLAVAPNNRRRVQARRMRHVKFTEARKRTFLEHFAGTCDAAAAARAAGVDRTTVYQHRRKDPVFAELWDCALAESYAALEAEAVRQRLAAQERLRDEIVPAGEMATEFEQVLKLLARWDRKNGQIGTRAIAHGRMKRWTFDEAMEALEKKLTALGYRLDEGPHHEAPGSSPGRDPEAPHPLPRRGEGEEE